MATSKESSAEEDAERILLEKEIGELRSVKKELFELSRPVNEELEKVAQRERECVDKLHRLIAEEHDREKQPQTVQRLIELESAVERLELENETLKREKSHCSDMNNKLRQSLNQATKYSRVQMQKITELNARLSAEQQLRLEEAPAVSETVVDSTVEDLQEQLSETRKLLSKTTTELSEMRQHLSEVQERLTVTEQVTAATQQRELQESDNSDELQLELTAQHQPTAHTGAV